MLTHFVKFAKTSGLSGSGLVNDQDQLLSPFDKSDQKFASYLTSERIAGLSMADFSFESVLSELILYRMDNGLEISKDVIRKNIATIVEQADRMVHIINHVRLFARDADSINTSIVDLNDVVCSGTSMLMAQFNSHGLLLEKDL